LFKKIRLKECQIHYSEGLDTVMGLYTGMISVVFGGGPGAAYEAQQFTWNDHVVIPISSTGGAAGGLFNVPEKIFEVRTFSFIRKQSILACKKPKFFFSSENSSAVLTWLLFTR